MRVRNILAAAAVVAGIGAMAATAEAKTNVHIGIGVGTPGYYYDPVPEPYYGGGYYAGPPVVRRVSCAYGADMVRDRGFRRVRARDCSGRTYSYIGWRGGWRYIVYVNARNGAVVGRDPI